ncbi:MAG: hypothetical protein QM809_17310 [Gordonia sp. (in: high G+C Gram-positive bacteria)]|uniref:hypothetical protein n=1 Tax=Gordonia sp. (in: high G+C Gram-positive bacteria) TaxID=84139 RepID=UPI0039E31DC0
MGKHTSRRTRQVTRSGHTFNISKTAVRKGATGATVVTAAAAVTASLALGPGAANAAASNELKDAAAALHTWATAGQDQAVDALGIKSGGHLGGVALGPNYLLDQIRAIVNSALPGASLGDAVVDQIVVRILNELGLAPGHELAIAILPGAAVAVPIGEGTSATAISILGVALATDGITKIFDDIWNLGVDDVLGGLIDDGLLDGLGLPGIGDLLDVPTLGELIETVTQGEVTRADLPADQVFCLGGFAYANSGSAGTCVNVAALIDGRYNKPTGEVQLGLTNPLSVLNYLVDPMSLLPVVGNALTGQPIYLLKDFARVSVNGPDYLAALTSSYGFEALPGGAPITVNWLGSSVQLFPETAAVHGTGGLIPGLGTPSPFVNYLSMPKVAFGLPTDISQIIPSVDFSKFNIFDLYTVDGWSTNGLLQGNLPKGQVGPMLQLLGQLGNILQTLTSVSGTSASGQARSGTDTSLMKAKVGEHGAVTLWPVNKEKTGATKNVSALKRGVVKEDTEESAEDTEAGSDKPEDDPRPKTPFERTSPRKTPPSGGPGSDSSDSEEGEDSARTPGDGGRHTPKLGGGVKIPKLGGGGRILPGGDRNDTPPSKDKSDDSTTDADPPAATQSKRPRPKLRLSVG